MPIKPVGVDESGRFPTRVRLALAEEFVTKPSGIMDGQVPVWNASTGTWVASTFNAGDGSVPSKIDGGSPSA